MKKLKQARGITLIALVITIIVLLILTGVSIATLTGEIGRYEVGSITARATKDDALTTPIIQQDAYPYNFVTCFKISIF